MRGCSGGFLSGKSTLLPTLLLCDPFFFQFHTRDPPLAVRDIKAANVLLTDEPITCLLMDFGSVAQARQVVRDKQDAVSLQVF